MPQEAVKVFQPINSAILPLETLSYFNPANPLIDLVEINTTLSHYYSKMRKYELTGKRNLACNIYRLRIKMPFSKVIDIALKNKIFKRYSFLEACILLPLIISKHIGQRNKRIIILLKSNSTNPIPYLHLLKNNNSKYQVYYGECYDDFVLTRDSLILFKPF